MEPVAGFDALMHDVCVCQGWCGGPAHVTDFIPESGSVTVDQFVDWLFEAEGLETTNDAEKWREHRKVLRDAFVRHMGNNVVDATELQWNFNLPPAP